MLISLAISYGLVEWLLFTRFLHALPSGLQGSVPLDIEPLTHSSKRGTVPRDYVAILGDSYAVGLGDWRIERAGGNWANGAFHSAHLIHDATGRNVVSFGRSGSGSFEGIVYYPLTTYAHLRSSRFDVERPRDVVIYFYGGNDLDNNLGLLHRHFKDRFDIERVMEPEYVDDAMRQLVEPDVAQIERSHGGFSKLYFARAVKQAVTPEPEESEHRPRQAAESEAVLRIGPEELTLPRALQGPALELSDEEVALAFQILDRSLAYLRRAWPEVSIGVVYIPSPLASYPIVSESVQAQSQQDREDVDLSRVVPASVIAPRSRELCGQVAEAARRHGVRFVDASSYVWEVTSQRTAHGPLDWKHFNRAGQEALAATAVAVLESTATGYDCAATPEDW